MSSHIIKEVQKLTKRFNTNCPFKLAEALGIHILFEDLGSTLGYYNQHFRIKIIHINQNESEQKQEFICAHELGHAILHPQANTPFLKRYTLYSTDKMELEANLFAVGLLFSNEKYDGQLSIREAVEEYGVPEKIISNSLDCAE
ncbi:Zn-dependent peptidase ImmA (M78 family) [Cytobacillus horneckiae]|uniref:ImmA/IrrE family metallo-endopeptidase n=1 Tax=Cytobacillus horneckiae TaxID=549687 RepID=A0A2N0ZDT7_9BACI|nr:ImmA/IrrE family metallo-endopeptidase [Cytobacillus horneckiae]MBN6885366.1 ImmA/IrrE family metallo-endopeptidase [Cytobacillus horneckiae]MCM3178911.1 ImmA/IrrE family metallo-endopeptidase [Cytobacillus horneckiae]MEC1154121.1 ImmA/IrrE family metallo-endopeptidase [Cytobacillus horneckiae]MED2936334.1 ImmA/IrrE family metallo-endopeptidase [Cytobacillus horneckiae]PKG27674.1 ImmA/IrrE family metallo-endopeptidase [Cytobacillus horneckiae]